MESEQKEVVSQCANKVLMWNEHNEDYIHPQMVDEALIYSYDASIVIRHLCNTFWLAKGDIEYLRCISEYNGCVEKKNDKNKCDVIVLSLPISSDDLLKEITLSMEKACGWLLACKTDTNLQGHEAWQYEKKKDNDATDEVFAKDFIFHLCPTSHLEKILHVGLISKKTTWECYISDDAHTVCDEIGQHYGWMTADRVHAFFDKPDDNFLQYNNLNEKNMLTDTYTLLGIDTKRLLANTKFSYDPRSERAVYTMGNIPPSAITVVK